MKEKSSYEENLSAEEREESSKGVTEAASSPCSMDEKDIYPDPSLRALQSPVIRLSNTILYCRHWKSTVAFYRDLLGFPVSFSRGDWFVELEVTDSTRISLADARHCTVEAVEGQGVTLSWQVDSLESIHHLLTGAGTRVSAVKSHGWRLPWFYAWDPEGHRIEFWSAG